MCGGQCTRREAVLAGLHIAVVAFSILTAVLLAWNKIDQKANDCPYANRYDDNVREPNLIVLPCRKIALRWDPIFPSSGMSEVCPKPIGASSVVKERKGCIRPRTFRFYPTHDFCLGFWGCVCVWGGGGGKKFSKAGVASNLADLRKYSANKQTIKTKNWHKKTGFQVLIEGWWFSHCNISIDLYVKTICEMEYKRDIIKFF